MPPVPAVRGVQLVKVRVLRVGDRVLYEGVEHQVGRTTC